MKALTAPETLSARRAHPAPVQEVCDSRQEQGLVRQEAMNNEGPMGTELAQAELTRNLRQNPDLQHSSNTKVTPSAHVGQLSDRARIHEEG